MRGKESIYVNNVNSTSFESALFWYFLFVFSFLVRPGSDSEPDCRAAGKFGKTWRLISFFLTIILKIGHFGEFLQCPTDLGTTKKDWSNQEEMEHWLLTSLEPVERSFKKEATKQSSSHSTRQEESCEAKSTRVICWWQLFSFFKLSHQWNEKEQFSSNLFQF